MAADSAWAVILELATVVGMVVSFALLGRTLGPSGYGGYASLYAVISPLVTLAASGVTLALLEHAIRHDEPLDQTARSCMSLSLGLGAVLCGVGWLMSSFVVESLTQVAIISILLTEFITIPLIYIAAGTVQSGANFAGAARIRLAMVGTRLVVVISLFALDTLTVASLGLTHLVATAILAAFVLARVGHRFSFVFSPGRVHLRHLKTNLVYSSAISAFAVQNDGDKAVLAANGYARDTGLYAAAYRIVLLGMVPVSALTQVTHRRFLIREDGVRGHHLRLAIRFGGSLAVYGLILAVGLIIAAPLLPLVIGSDFEESIQMVRWLSPLVLLRALSMFALNGLMGLGRTKLRTLLISIIAAIGMLLYLALIPSYGWKGAVAGTLASEVILVVVSWAALLLCQRSADRQIESDTSELLPQGGNS